MDVSGDAGAGSFADVHAEVDAVGVVEVAQDGFHPLGEGHHLIRGFGREFAQFVQVRVGHDHDVSRSVGIGVQDDEAMLAAINNARLLVVVCLNGVAEYASRSFLSGGNVGVTPRGPEVVHDKAG